MRRQRPSISEFIEHRLLGPINALFLLLPLVLLAIELASFAGLHASQPTEVDVAEVDRAPEVPAAQDAAREARLETDDGAAALAAPLTGYGLL